MKPLSAGLLAAALALAAPAHAAEPLPDAEPESLGFDPEALEALDARFREKIEAGDMPGAIIYVAREGQVAHLSTLGDLRPDGPEMREDAIFRIYSMTKPITSVAIMMLVEQGRLSLADPLHAYIPEFEEMEVATEEGRESARRPITIQDLLRHSSGLTYGFFGAGPAREAYKEAGVGDTSMTGLESARQLAGLPLEHQPGTAWEYSRATDVLGTVVEVVTDKPLGEALDEMVFQPLGMEDTAFYHEDEARHDRIAEPFEEHAKIGDFDMFDPREARAYESGGGGLVSTVRDYARFAEMLLNGGELDGARLLSPETVAWMTSDHLGERIAPGKYYLPGPGYGFGLGFGVRLEKGVAPANGNPGEYYWGGAAGTYWWNDPQTDMTVIYMMQSPPARVPVRALLRDMVYGAMTE
ncbi:MAG: serine hydrolase domain-containing protein [Pseudomonadota bacterium]